MIGKKNNSHMLSNNTLIKNLNAIAPAKRRFLNLVKFASNRIEIRKGIMRNSTAVKFSSSDTKISTVHSRKYKFCASAKRVTKEKAIAASMLNCRSNQLNALSKVIFFLVLTI